MSIHLLPWRDQAADVDFARLTRTVRVNADYTWTIQHDVSEPCDHTDDPDGPTECAGADVITRALFGHLLVTFGNGSLRHLDVVPLAFDDPTVPVEQAVGVLVHLGGWSLVDGPTPPYPDEGAVEAWRQAQAEAEAEKEAHKSAMEAMSDPSMLRQIGTEMLKRAAVLEGSTLTGDTDRVGQYV